MPKITTKNRGPKGRWRKRRQTVKTFIHVNQHKIRENRQNKTKNPVILVKQGKNSTICNAVTIPRFGRIIYDPEHPKNCGATVWLEIEPHIRLTMSCFAEVV